MSDTSGIQQGNSQTVDDSVLQEKIREYREMLKKQKPDMDMQLLFRIMRLMNESSEVHVGIDPIGEDGTWDSHSRTYSVQGVVELPDGRVALRVNSEKHGIKIDELERKLHKTFKRSTGAGVPVLFVQGETVTQLTDAYSHALVREQWAGMPFDLVLAVKTPKTEE